MTDFSHQVLEAFPYGLLLVNPDRSIRFVNTAAKAIFARRGFEFYDFSDFTDLGAGDEEAVDSFHGSEKVYVRLMLKMLHAGSVLGRYADAAVLESDLQRASKNWDIVGREP